MNKIQLESTVKAYEVLEEECFALLGNYCNIVKIEGNDFLDTIAYITNEEIEFSGEDYYGEGIDYYSLTLPTRLLYDEDYKNYYFEVNKYHQEAITMNKEFDKKVLEDVKNLVRFIAVALETSTKILRRDNGNSNKK